MKHVAVFREVLAEAARNAGADIGGKFGVGVRRAATLAELQRQVSTEINGHLAQYIGQWQRVLTERQDGVDSPQEYTRVATACNR